MKHHHLCMLLLLLPVLVLVLVTVSPSHHTTAKATKRGASWAAIRGPQHLHSLHQNPISTLFPELQKRSLLSAEEHRTTPEGRCADRSTPQTVCCLPVSCVHPHPYSPWLPCASVVCFSPFVCLFHSSDWGVCVFVCVSVRLRKICLCLWRLLVHTVPRLLLLYRQKWDFMLWLLSGSGGRIHVLENEARVGDTRSAILQQMH